MIGPDVGAAVGESVYRGDCYVSDQRPVFCLIWSSGICPAAAIIPSLTEPKRSMPVLYCLPNLESDLERVARAGEFPPLALCGGSSSESAKWLSHIISNQFWLATLQVQTFKAPS